MWPAAAVSLFLFTSSPLQPQRLVKSRKSAILETMLAPEFILFLMLDIMVLIWTILKVLVNHLIDSGPHLPPRATVEPSESSDHLRRVA